MPTAKFTDAAVYSCAARNKVGEASFNVELKVVGKKVKKIHLKHTISMNLKAFFVYIKDKDSFVPPQFIEHLREIIIPEGKDAVLSCTAIGTPLTALIWEKDGKQLTPDKEFR